MSYRVYRRRWQTWMMVFLLVLGLGPMWGVTGGITKAEAATTSWSNVGPAAAAPSNVYALADVNGTLYAGTYIGRNDVWTYENGTWTQFGVSLTNRLTL